ncbi:MAG: WxcM-like domain-containing protein [Kiritimatiellae bacterium]|nr:WxcM-like domain-containing protein [Kiritimatiellia bacterium]
MDERLIEGGKHEDARGKLRFCNDFDMTAVKRFYTIANSKDAPVRGWIGHKRERKWFFPLKGKTVIEIEPMDMNYEAHEIHKRPFELDAERPEVLLVKPWNWFCIKQDGEAEVMVFSDCRVGEYKDDDFRRSI